MADDNTAARPKIADIIRDAGAVGGESSGPSIGDLAGVGVLLGESVASLTASMTISQAIGQRFNIHAEGTAAHVFAAPYALTARAIVLALHAQNHHLISALDTAGGCAIEAKTGMTLLHNAASLLLQITETDAATTTVTGHSDLQGQFKDWGSNARILNDIYAKAGSYISLLSA